jgi:hypothetical protein
MKLQLTMQLGDKSISISSEGTEKEVMKEASFWSQIPTSCGSCKSTDISLNYREPKGFEYYGLHCNSCHANLNFGQAKSGGFFVRGDSKWEVYKGEKKFAPRKAAPQPEPPMPEMRLEDQMEDVPF